MNAENPEEPSEPAAELRSLPMYRPAPVDFTVSTWRERTEREIHWAAHAHPTHELVTNDKGGSMVTIADVTYTLIPGQGFWIPAGTVHSGVTPRGTLARAYQLSITDTPKLAEHPVVVEITDLLDLLLLRLGEEDLSERSRHLTEQMVMDLLRPARYPLAIPTVVSPLISQVTQTLMDNPGDQRTLASWSKRLNVSERTITRAFRTEMGLSFRDWVSRNRIHHAVLLMSSEAAIEEVSEQVGYASVSAFGAAFRRITGSTPAAFREEMRQRSMSESR